MNPHKECDKYHLIFIFPEGKVYIMNLMIFNVIEKYKIFCVSKPIFLIKISFVLVFKSSFEIFCLFYSKLLFVCIELESKEKFLIENIFIKNLNKNILKHYFHIHL